MADNRIVRGRGGTLSSEALVSEAGDVVLADKHIGSTTLCNKGSAGTITLPSDATNNYPIGTRARFIQGTANAMTVTAGSGVTLRSRGGLVATNGQWAAVDVEKIAANTWHVSGDRA